MRWVFLIEDNWVCMRYLDWRWIRVYNNIYNKK